MRYSISVRATFSSTHRASEPVRCSFPHGHDFEVKASLSHELLDDGVPRGGRGFDVALHDLVGEFDKRPLDQMAPGVNQTMVGLASYFFERLVATYPGLSSVEVSDGRYTGTAYK